MQPPDSLGDCLLQFRRYSLLAGLAGGLGCAVAWWLSPVDFFAAYLFAYLFWLGISLGSLVVLMIHCLTGGVWGLAIRRVLESAFGNLPLLVVLFIPLLFGYQELYPWARPEVVAEDPLLQLKQNYLNVPAVELRTLVYFVIWTTMALLMYRWTAGTGADDDPLQRRAVRLSGPGILIYGITITLASIDWGMSLEPHWFSTMYGILYLAGQGLSGLAFGVAVSVAVSRFSPHARETPLKRWHDLGNLLLAFVMFWAYVAYMQYLIIWSGNLPEENPWYLRRTHAGWQWIGIGLIAMHFFFPFLLLLCRSVKRRTRSLALVAVWLLAWRMIDLYWLIMPVFVPELRLQWQAVVALLAIGGFWLATFAWNLSRRAELPLDDPELTGATDGATLPAPVA